MPAAGRTSTDTSPQTKRSAGDSAISRRSGGNAASSGSKTPAPNRSSSSRISCPARTDPARMALAAARLNPGSAAIAPWGARSAAVAVSNAATRVRNRPEPSALDVLQELDAQAFAGVGALDDARDVRDDETAMVRQGHHAQVRLERREGVIGDLRPGGRDHGEECALPGVRLPQQTHIGNELEDELEPAFLSILTRLPLPRAAVGGRREARVAPPAASAARHDHAVARGQHFSEQRARFGITHFGARWNWQGEIRARLPGHAFPLAVLPPLGFPVRAVAVVEERGQVRIGAHEYAAARPAIAAIGSALGHELFAAKGAGTGAAGTGHNVDDCTVYEHCGAECGVRNAECGVEGGARRAVRMDDTVIATISPASWRSEDRRSQSKTFRSRRRSIQNSHSSAS